MLQRPRVQRSTLGLAQNCSGQKWRLNPVTFYTLNTGHRHEDIQGGGGLGAFCPLSVPESVPN